MTQLEICNRALALLGHDRTITSLSDGSTEAARCSLFYSVARDNVLADFAWEWAIKTLALAANTDVNLPADCVRVVDVRAANGDPVQAKRSAGKIRATAAGTLRYVSNSVGEATFPPAVADAIVHELAFRLYGPILGNPTTQDAVASQQAFAALAQAKLETAKAVELEEHAFMGAPKDPSAVAQTDVANRALAVAGSVRLIRDFSEDPCAEAIRCRQLYPMALKRVLSAHPFEFAQKTVTAASSPYTLPSDFISIVAVKNASGTPIAASLADGTLVFTGTNVRITYISSSINLAKAPQPFVEAVVMTLASALAPGLMSGEGGTQKAQFIVQQAEYAILSAKDAENRESAWRGSPANPDALVKTDFANRALALVGSSATVKDFDTDGDPIAVRCRQLLPMAMKRVLSSFPWEFARKTVIAASSPYTLPSDFQSLVSVKTSTGSVINATISDGTLVFTGSNAKVTYSSSNVNVSKMPSRISDAIVSALAVSLAPGFSDAEKDPQATRAQMLMKQYEADLAQAVTGEATEAAWRGAPANPDSLMKTDVANRALALLGAAATIKDYDTDPEPVAVRCRQLLPMALKRVVSAHSWEFCEKTITATNVAYLVRPNDFVRLVSVKQDGIVINARLADDRIVFPTTGIYDIKYVSSSVVFERIPPYVSEAIAFQLAALLSPTYIEGETAAQKAQIILKQAENSLAVAIETDLQDAAWRAEPADPTSLAKTDVANRALALLGSPVTIKDFDSDTGVLAARIRQLYRMSFDRALRFKDWDFACEEIQLALTAPDMNGYAKLFAPEDCARLCRCFDEHLHPVEIRRMRDFYLVKTDARKVTVRYVSRDVTADGAPPEFIELVSLDLAAAIAPTALAGVKNGAQTAQAIAERARRAFAAEDFTEANETASPGEWENPLVACRR